MGEHTPVLQDSETVEVSLDFTVRAKSQLARMQEPVRELAQAALLSFAARMGNYFSEEIDDVSYVGRTREEIFCIAFEVFGPSRATIHDIVMDLAPIDESKGYFRISRNGKTIVLPIPLSDSTHSRIFEIVDDYKKIVAREYFCDRDISDVLNSIKYDDARTIFRNIATKSRQFRNRTVASVEFSDILKDDFASNFAASTAHCVDYPVDLSCLSFRDDRRAPTGDGAAAVLLVEVSRQCFDVAISAHCTD